MNVSPKKITFPSPPFGIVTIKEGQLGYKRTTRIRLKKNKRGEIFFPAKGSRLYVQDSKNPAVFRLREK